MIRQTKTWRSVFLATCVVASLGSGCANAQTPRFPPPDRPVAPIVTPTYSTEAARDEHGEAERVLSRLSVKPGMRVADVGAGTGYFSRYLSTAVGAAGTVLSVDTEPALVGHLRERAEKEKTDNVVPILASADNPRLPRGAVDLVLLVDTFHHLDQRVAYFGRLRRTLAPGGRVAVVDWQKRETPVGPELEHRLAREQVVDEMRAAGYALVDEPDVLPYQYCLVFRPR